MRTRSWLIASSLNPKLMAKSHLVSADVALFDLEDSVATAEKEAARAALAERLCQSPEVATAVRVNTLTSLEGVKDLLFLVSHDVAPDIVILPRSRSPTTSPWPPACCSSVTRTSGCSPSSRP